MRRDGCEGLTGRWGRSSPLYTLWSYCFGRLTYQPFLPWAEPVSA
jgi:hypothetical protein